MSDVTYLRIKGAAVPIKLKRAWRNSVRYSISQKSVNLTIPQFYTKRQTLDELNRISSWAHKKFELDPGMLERFRIRKYATGDKLQIYGHIFTLLINSAPIKGLTGEIHGEQVIITLPKNTDKHSQHSMVGPLLSRLFAKHFHTAVSRRVHHLNNTYFKETINNIRIKNNQSNWGSCSSNRNINLSSRLLFAPQKVFDYVIIHELAHLKEMNHSPRFWNIVAKAMPDYKKYDTWLTKEGHSLRF